MPKGEHFPGAELAVGGENLIDYVTRDGVVTAKAGGSPYNVALALGRQGAAIRYVSPISQDSWGETLANTLAASDVHLTGGRRSQPTTMARVTVRAGTPDYQFEREATAERDVTEHDLLHSIGPAQGLHTGSLALTDGTDAQVWEDVMSRAAERGLFTSIDPNVRMSVVRDRDSYRNRVLRMMRRADLLKFSDEDLAALFPGVTEADALDQVHAACSASFTVMTRGADGVTGWLKGRRIDVAAPKVPDLVDTVGAGDTFMATLLATLAKHDRLSKDALADMTQEDSLALLTRAGVAAALNCAREGCDPPTDDDITRAMA